MNLQEQDQTQVEEKPEQASAEEKKSETYTVEVKGFGIPASLANMVKDLVEKEVNAFEDKIRAENPHFVELIVNSFERTVPVFFPDQAQLDAFVAQWKFRNNEQQIVINNVKLKSDLVSGKTQTLVLSKGDFTGLKFND